MEYIKLGNTDIEVSKLCVECMSFGKTGVAYPIIGATQEQTVNTESVEAVNTKQTDWL